jgi:hypothetical protein
MAKNVKITCPYACNANPYVSIAKDEKVKSVGKAVWTFTTTTNCPECGGMIKVKTKSK